jgi:hypothetical protein
MPYIGNDIQYGELNSQTFTGDGSTTAFTLTYTVSNVNSLLVTVADVIQEPTTAYTVSGTTLTFTSAPANLDTIHVRYLGRTLDVGTTAIVQDSDQDTKIQVEESADEDTIRFDVAGTEVATATNTYFKINNSLVNTAASGIIESNANFVDTCLVGPSVDGKAWSGKFENGSVWSSLMLASVETSGSDAEVNIWDLTAGALASASPLATLTLTGATPTSIAASMGYVIVGTSDQGFHIVDPHYGSWAERTVGWPRSLTASTSPALSDNNVQSVNATIAGGAPYDPRTGGSVPTFVIGLGATKDFDGIMDNGTVVAAATNTSLSNIVGVHNDFMIYESNTAGNTYYGSISYARDNAGWSIAQLDGSGGYPLAGTVNSMGGGPGAFLVGRDVGLIGYVGSYLPGSVTNSVLAANRTKEAWATFAVTNAYNSGYMPGQVNGATRLAALANSKTADRSGFSNTLTENGTVTEAAVETGAELMGYSGFSESTNYLSRAADADFNIGTGDITMILWFKGSSFGAYDSMLSIDNAGAAPGVSIQTGNSSGFLAVTDVATSTPSDIDVNCDDGLWHQAAFVRRGTGANDCSLYFDGVEIDTFQLATSLNGSLPVGVGAYSSGVNAFTNGNLAIPRISASAASALQVRKIYEAEKGMFAANAKCLLQGAGNAVLDARVDPLTGKYIVTQSDTQDIFDGLKIETERTIAAGGTTFEHGLLWGDAVAEINDANLFASTPATDQRQVNEMVRSMAAELPAGVDLSKAKAWGTFDGSGVSIHRSFNIESLARTINPGGFKVTFSVPFKSASSGNNFPFAVFGMTQAQSAFDENIYIGGTGTTSSTAAITIKNDAGTGINAQYFSLVFFGELENE